MLAQFDPLSPEFRANPYPYYDMLRSAMPIAFLPDWNMWFVTRHEDCGDLLRDQRLGHEILRVMEPEELGWATDDELPEDHVRLHQIRRRWMLFRDPPDHTRLRGLVHKAFTPRMIEKLRSHIEAITANLLNQVEAQGQMDVIADLAVPLPVTVIAELLGVPLQDQEMFRGWSRDLAGTLELTGPEDYEIWDRAAGAAVEFDAYFLRLAEERRHNPQDDLLSALVQAEEEGDKLTEDELIATCILLLIAGHETTVNLIGNGAYALLSHPEQRGLLQNHLNDAEFVKNAVEELLRYDSPVQMTTRWIMQDFDFQGHTFKTGQSVAIMFGAANRDPERFENPNALDLTRQNNKHLSFGNGIHFCLGAPLARMEGQIAMRELFRRFPSLQLKDAAPEYRNTYLLRGLKSLPAGF